MIRSMLKTAGQGTRPYLQLRENNRPRVLPSGNSVCIQCLAFHHSVALDSAVDTCQMSMIHPPACSRKIVKRSSLAVNYHSQKVLDAKQLVWFKVSSMFTSCMSLFNVLILEDYPVVVIPLVDSPMWKMYQQCNVNFQMSVHVMSFPESSCNSPHPLTALAIASALNPVDHLDVFDLLMFFPGQHGQTHSLNIIQLHLILQWTHVRCQRFIRQRVPER